MKIYKKGEYEINEFISEGTYGIVYNGFVNDIVQKVIFKKYNFLNENHFMIQSFYKDFLVSINLNEKNINVPKIYGIIYDNDTEIYLIMQHLDGTIHDLLDNYHELSETVIEKIQVELKKMHSHGYVHGDIKFSNIMYKYKNIDYDDFDVYFIDFGFCDYQNFFPSELDIYGYTSSLLPPEKEKSYLWDIYSFAKSIFNYYSPTKYYLYLNDMISINPRMRCKKDMINLEIKYLKKYKWFKDYDKKHYLSSYSTEINNINRNYIPIKSKIIKNENKEAMIIMIKWMIELKHDTEMITNLDCIINVIDWLKIVNFENFKKDEYQGLLLVLINIYKEININDAVFYCDNSISIKRFKKIERKVICNYLYKFKYNSLWSVLIYNLNYDEEIDFDSIISIIFVYIMGTILYNEYEDLTYEEIIYKSIEYNYNYNSDELFSKFIDKTKKIINA